jgi:hypothetical protein
MAKDRKRKREMRSVASSLLPFSGPSFLRSCATPLHPPLLAFPLLSSSHVSSKTACSCVSSAFPLFPIAISFTLPPSPASSFHSSLLPTSASLSSRFSPLLSSLDPSLPQSHLLSLLSPLLPAASKPPHLYHLVFSTLFLVRSFTPGKIENEK